VVRVIASTPEVVAWHDVECASYAADLPLWLELAASADGVVLDIGCGTGRVALDLAANGHQVMGIDSDPELVRTLRARARDHRLDTLGPYRDPNRPVVEGAVADARSFALGRRFALAIAPMQVVQLVGGPAGRAKVLERVRAHLQPGGMFAAALADPFEGFEPHSARPPLPDIREENGWVLSSTPVAVRAVDGAVEIERHRQAVSPTGDLREELATIRLDSLDARTLEAEARAAGFQALEPRRVPETPDHVGSTVVVLQC
jgi:SAM-dependent methyltransferase